MNASDIHIVHLDASKDRVDHIILSNILAGKDVCHTLLKLLFNMETQLIEVTELLFPHGDDNVFL